MYFCFLIQIFNQITDARGTPITLYAQKETTCECNRVVIRRECIQLNEPLEHVLRILLMTSSTPYVITECCVYINEIFKHS